MVYYFYHLNYNTPPLHVIEDEEAIDQINTHNVDNDIIASRFGYSDLVVHAKVYALAGKYFIYLFIFIYLFNINVGAVPS